MTQISLLATALRLYDEHGLVTIPVRRKDGDENDKRPAISSWQDLYKTKPDRAKLEAAWSGARQHEGMALLCGEVELLEADVKNDPQKDIHMRLMQAVQAQLPHVFEKLYIQVSPSGGIHLWYRVQPGEVKGNQPDIAKVEYTDSDRFILGLDSDTKTGVIVETRGLGGYALIVPSPGYAVLQGSLDSLPLLTTEEREMMLLIGRSFNTYNPMEVRVDYERAASSAPGTRPGDMYNQAMTPMDLVRLLEGYGWTQLRTYAGAVWLARPGQPVRGRHGGKVSLTGNFFVNYSSSVGYFTPMKGYSPFYVYAYLAHGGDFPAATRALAAAGHEHPDRKSKPQSKPMPWEIAAQSAAVTQVYDDIEVPASFDDYGEAVLNGDALAPDDQQFLDYIRKYRVSMKERPKITWNLFLRHNGRDHGLAFPGALVVVYGQAKARKTTVLGVYIAALLKGGMVSNVRASQPARKILWIDTEQGEYFAWETIWRVYVQSDLSDETERFEALALVDMSAVERLAAIDKLVNLLDPDVVVVDGAVDVMEDINDSKETGRVIQFFNSWKSGKRMVFTVCHFNPKEKKARGHIGTWLTNKCDVAIECEPDTKDDTHVKVRCYRSRGSKFPAYDLYAGQDGILYNDEWPGYDTARWKPERASKLVDHSLPGLGDGSIEDAEAIEVSPALSSEVAVKNIMFENRRKFEDDLDVPF